ncbi:GGDEF domain-containing protein [Pleionea sediminis]|uniref:GGDEF domain-containing protein n=1 Tax=Pleionea sediminis TaxID=2569479 RepID=UPI001185021A|nr:sensor domain-containing diguanylate cyclase [Pleionea sediminis]
MKFIKKAHPVAKINFLPRLLAAYTYLLIAGVVSGERLVEVPAIFVLIAGLLWPFTAILLAARWTTKRQEVINMHIDAVLTSCIFLIAPGEEILFAVLLVLLTNATFIGALKLLISTIMLTSLVSFGGMYLFDIDWAVVPGFARLLIMSFLILYFIFFAFMGFKLIQNFLNLANKVKQISRRDPLTGCYNRLYLDKELPKEINRSLRIHYPLTVIFVDVDHFKKINDSYGHSVGDSILKSFVDIAQTCIRDGTDWVARFGGEEFVIVLTNSDSEKGVLVAERVRERVEQYIFRQDDIEINITCSFGVAALETFERQIRAETLLKQADVALYIAKDSGRNRVELCERHKKKD